jgi:hypothetical protein
MSKYTYMEIFVDPMADGAEVIIALAFQENLMVFLYTCWSISSLGPYTDISK